MSEYDDAYDNVVSFQQSARQTAVGSIDESPDTAQRAIELGKATGTPAPVVYGDVDGFEKQHKSAMAASIVSNNNYIQEYLNANPMAGKISNDDYGNLDNVSQATQKASGPSILGSVYKGFMESGGAGPVGSWLPEGYASRNPIGAFGWAALGSPIEVPMRMIGATVGAIREGAGAVVEADTGSKDKGDLVRTAIGSTAEYLMTTVDGANLLHQHGMEAAHNAAVNDMVAKAKPYIEAGMDPPAGLHPEIDQLKIKQNKLDLDALNEAVSEAQTSSTKERAPDMFADFVRQHTDAKIGVSADAVRAMYGDKLPHAEDGMLGWVPNLADQMATAEATGGDVQIPMADWIAKVDPQVSTALNDHIRVRDGNITAAEVEAKNTLEEGIERPPEPTPEEGAIPDPVQDMRQALGLTVYHGSPYDFDKFDVSKIGTGEGAQSYGHGLYFAENPAVSKAYQDKLSGRTINGEPFDQNKPEHAAAEATNLFGDKLPEHMQTMEGDIANLEKSKLPGDAKQLDKMQKTLGILKSGGVPKFDEGHHYQAQITAPREAFLDWDKPLSEQSPQVLEKLLKLAEEHDLPFDRELNRDVVTGEQFYEHLKDVLATHKKLPPNEKGFYRLDDGREAASKALSDAGIPGIKYLDQGSRDKAEGTSNFVVFNDKDVQITHKNDQPTMLDQVNDTLRGVGEKLGLVEPKPETIDVQKLPSEAEREFANAKAIGMTVDEFRRYQKKIIQQAVEDREAVARRVERAEKKRQSAEWTQHENELRPQVVEDVKSHPDVAADLLLGNSELYGKGDVYGKLDYNSLTAEQRAKLPEKYVVKKNGYHPDEVANIFGFESGDAMIERLAEYNKAKDASGLRGDRWMRKIVNDELARRMEETYGKLDENIADEVKQQVESQTQLDLLHAEVKALANRAGVEYPITKEEIQARVKETFDASKVGNVSEDRFLRDVGKAGRTAERHLLRDDPHAAFLERQRQYLAMSYAREARAFEKTQAAYDRTVKRFKSREVKGVSQEYTNYIHDIMLRTGEPPRRSVQDLQEELARVGYNSFADFVQDKEGNGRELHMPKFIQDAAFNSKIDDLSVGDFKELAEGMKAMAFNGRNELKVTKQGELADLNEVIDQMVEKLKTLGPAKAPPIDRKPNPISETFKYYGWSGINVESMMNRLDRDDPFGVFNQSIVRPFVEASNAKDAMIKKYQAKIATLGKMEGMDKQIENALFKDPLTGEPLQMRRRNVLGILQNVGNADNMRKLAGGYGVEPAAIMDWLGKHTTKEDWDRAQKIGDLFNELHEEASQMSHRVSGVGIRKIQLDPVETPFGTYEGWYNPVKYDPLRPGTSMRATAGRSVVEGDGYFKATTPQGYTKDRTGYIAPVDLNLDVVPIRMKQMIHDITTREAAVQLSKFFENPKFMRAVTTYYGKHQMQALQPFLRDFVNSSNFQSATSAWGNQALEYFRQNTITTLVGLNPGTVAKHSMTAAVNSLAEVGPLNFAREFKNVFATDEVTGERNFKMAWDKSEELQRRVRNYQEIVQGHGGEIGLKGAKPVFNTLRDTMAFVGSAPISLGDFMSAVPTWLAKYHEALAEGRTEGDAIFLGDRAVRNAHGSSVLTNRPEIARGQGGISSWFTSLYGFFSEMQQRQYKLAWKAADAYKEGSLLKESPHLAAGLFTYVIAPAMIEELVTPYTTQDNESWATKAGKMMAMGIGSSLIGVRDAVRAAINVRDPQAGLMGTTLKSGTDLYRDLSGKERFTKEKTGKLINHTVALTGILTGLTNAQEGKLAEYGYRYATGLEKPKGPFGVAVGMRYGTTTNHSLTYDAWLKHMKGH